MAPLAVVYIVGAKPSLRGCTLPSDNAGRGNTSRTSCGPTSAALFRIFRPYTKLAAILVRPSCHIWCHHRRFGLTGAILSAEVRRARPSPT